MTTETDLMKEFTREQSALILFGVMQGTRKLALCEVEMTEFWNQGITDVPTACGFWRGKGIEKDKAWWIANQLHKGVNANERRRNGHG